MARPSNSFDSVPMTIAITPQMRVYLDDLTLKGTHGCSPADAARMVLSRAIEDMLNKGDIKKREFAVKDGEVIAVPTAA